MALQNSSPISLTSRIIGFFADLLLLALFLAFGVALLNIFIQVIVLVVGIYRVTTSTPGMPGAEDSTRITRDILDLGFAIFSALAAGVLYWAYLRLRRRYIHLFVGTGFETFVSKRYLLAREGGRLVGLISVVSVLGVAVGVMALIVVLSVMQGFDRELVKKFMGIFSHVEVFALSSASENIPPEVYEPMMEQMRKHPDVVGVAPIISHKTAVQKLGGAEERKELAYFRGIDTELERNVTEFQNYVRTGKADPGTREVVVGSQLARALGVRVGDNILALGQIIATANRPAVKTSTLKVVGIFESGLYDVDNTFIYTNIETVQMMLLMEKEVNSIHIKIRDPQDVERVRRELDTLLPRGYVTRTWQEINPEFFKALWIEKVAMFIILLLIVLVAALNIIGTLVMTVVQKTRDIGILKSMGANNSAILRIFLYHGFLIGLLGTSLGTAWGLRLCQFVSNDIEKIFELPPGVYGLDRLPVVVEPQLIGLMAGSALLICILAAIIPAYQAARLHPVEALRYD